MYDSAASVTALSGVGALGMTEGSAQLRRLLETQARELDAVLARFTEARSLLPRHSDNSWRGLAHLFYELKLNELGSDLGRVHEQLSSALRQTRRAVDTLGDRVG